MEEKKLVEAIIQKDDKALRMLYFRYKKPIFQYVTRRINDRYLAEEITQDVFLDFIEALRDFRFQSSIKTFIYTLAKNKIVDTFRKKKIKKILFSAMPAYIVEGLKTIFIDDEIEQKELANKIKKTMDKLPNDYEFVLRLKYVEGEKVKKIAQRLSLGFKATESLIFRARKAFVAVFIKLP